MARPPRIPAGARPTTLYLTARQRAAISKLQAKRLEESDSQPGLTDLLTEALRLLLESEGWSSAELEQLFPKSERKRAAVQPFPKRKRRGF